MPTKLPFLFQLLPASFFRTPVGNEADILNAAQVYLTILLPHVGQVKSPQ